MKSRTHKFFQIVAFSSGLLLAQGLRADPVAVNIARSAKGWTAARGTPCFTLYPTSTVAGSFWTQITNDNSSDSNFTYVEHGGSSSYQVAVYNTDVDMGGANCFALSGYNEDRYDIAELQNVTISNIAAVLVNPMNQDGTYSLTILSQTGYWNGTEWVSSVTFSDHSLKDSHGLTMFRQSGTTFLRLPLHTAHNYGFSGDFSTITTVDLSSLSH